MLDVEEKNTIPVAKCEFLFRAVRNRMFCIDEFEDFMMRRPMRDSDVAYEVRGCRGLVFVSGKMNGLVTKQRMYVCVFVGSELHACILGSCCGSSGCITCIDFSLFVSIVSPRGRTCACVCVSPRAYGC